MGKRHMPAPVSSLAIQSPKRVRRLQTGWEGFFPYYAGYPESFADAILKSAELEAGSLIFDPWNGSGTTMYAARQTALKGVGFDINPAMVIVARARLLYSTEADSLEPLGAEIARFAADAIRTIDDEDPLLIGFARPTASAIRSIERAICDHLVGGSTTNAASKLEHLSYIAAANYVALFAVCRRLAKRFYSSNPTWIRRRRDGEPAIRVTRELIKNSFLKELRSMASALAARPSAAICGFPHAEIRWADSTAKVLSPQSVDFVLSSPPYCTRIDYTAATRVELAVGQWNAGRRARPQAEGGASRLSVVRTARRLRAGNNTMRLPAFRFLSLTRDLDPKTATALFGITRFAGGEF
jgi:hypothetical protein